MFMILGQKVERSEFNIKPVAKKVDMFQQEIILGLKKTNLNVVLFVIMH